MSTTSLSLDEIYNLAKKTLLFNGCDEENANILSCSQAISSIKCSIINMRQI